MKKRLLLCGTLLCVRAYAQTPEDAIKTKNFPHIPKIHNTEIPGASVLAQPILIAGTEQDVRTEKHGLVYPAFFDWNHDGKDDLLLGEFKTGQTGSYIKVFLNYGTNQRPKYSGKYFYAKDVKGDLITNYQWCCIGIHPRMVDLDGDGYVDILSGQYNPGQISWWRGSKDGFQPRQFVDQEGYPEGKALDQAGDLSQLDPRSNDYWNYTSAGFGDFNGDGLPDLFVGGFGELRVALNTGTRTHPKFGLRKYLLGLDGHPLSVVNPSQKELETAKKLYTEPHYAGVVKSFITPVDWDGDGVLDLLVTHLYGNRNTKDPVVFFRGVNTDKGLRFEVPMPLFTAEDAHKTFPGCQPNITITDYNHDGVPDLVIGISIPTVNGFEADSLAAWSYLDDLHMEAPGKDAGLAAEYPGGIEAVRKKIEASPALRSFYLGKMTDEKYLTLRHRGYVFVMLGKKNPVKAKAKVGVKATDEFKPVANETLSNGGQGAVSYQVKAPAVMRLFETRGLEVILNFKDGWYGYANTPANIGEGWIPTKIEYILPPGFELAGQPVLPTTQLKGSSEIYRGGELRFQQKITLKPASGVNFNAGEYSIGVNITYQTCNQEKCLPPVTEHVDIKINCIK